MMKKINTMKLYFIITVSVAFIVTIMRTVSLLTAYDTAIGYYSSTAILPYIQKVTMICSAIFFLSYIFIEKKNTLPTHIPAASQFSTFASLLCGTVSISSAALLLMYQRGTMNTATLLILVGFSAATIYFFYDALCPSEKKSPFSVIPAIIAIHLRRSLYLLFRT